MEEEEIGRILFAYIVEFSKYKFIITEPRDV